MRIRHFAVLTFLLASVACGTTATTPPTNSPVTDAGSTADGAAGTADGTSGDTTAVDAGAADANAADSQAPDAAGTDANAADTVDPKADAATADAQATDGSATDGSATDSSASDVSSTDGGAFDGGSADAKPDTDTASSKCTQDSECAKLGFGDCLLGKCNVDTGLCTTQLATDGAACKVGGVCGGTGSCKQGACEGANVCGPAPCAAKVLKCGDKFSVDATTLGASKFSVWPCSDKAWGGGEQAFTLSSDVTQTAEVALTTGVGDTGKLIYLGTIAGGLCNPQACSKTADKLVLGVPAGVSQGFVLETAAGATGNVTITVTCSVAKKCGDGQCTAGETCEACPTDCGKCPTCGDKTCDKATENCAGCPEDCGDCNIVPLPECATKATPSVAGEFACTDCVCKLDSFCCQKAWDSTCVSECTNDCGGPLCVAPSFCGDGDCDFGSEYGKCASDCGDQSTCGDGACNGSEFCGNCATDCGICPGATLPTCGDGKCDANEHCGVCPKDCGVCSSECATMQPKKTPGCPGCACEAEVCADDPYCCEVAWDSVCVNACLSGKSIACPKVACGDGICSGGESCDSCNKDCGKCVCGDGTCSFSENSAECPADCPAGCSSSPTPGCGGCACEAEVCAADSFCCKTAWDNACVSQCKATGKMPCK